jgi:hypothetical protein
VRYALILLGWLTLGAAAAATEPQFPLTSGEYDFQVADAEFDGTFSYSARVSIQGVYIKVVITDCDAPFPCNTDIFNGTIWWHARSKHWIIATSQEDYDAEEVGGCSAGPMTIDPDRRIIWYC